MASSHRPETAETLFLRTESDIPDSGLAEWQAYEEWRNAQTEDD